MKMMWAECCNTLVVPSNKNYYPKFCDCRKSAVWWRDGQKGNLTIFSEHQDFVSVVGLHNKLLAFPMDAPWVRKDDIRKMLDETSENYYFKTFDSLVIRIRPGISSDVRFTSKREQVPIGNTHHEEDV